MLSQRARAFAFSVGLAVMPLLGSAPAAAAQSDTPPECLLFSADDVAGALGEPVVANNRFGCEYDSLPDTHPFKVVRFLSWATAPEAFQARSQEFASNNGGTSSWQPAAGIGDEAYAWRDDFGGGRLDVRSGGHAVEIWVDLGVFGAPDLDAKMAIANQLALLAAQRLNS